jgi:hypothetical protein
VKVARRVPVGERKFSGGESDFFLGAAGRNAPLERGSAIANWGRNEFELLHFQNPLDLLQVIEIVAGKHADDVFDRLLSALGVHPIMFPLIGR